ncbi:MAG: Para-hydroxybenzoate--polyprenyltransferase, mitochondrial precursor (PHB:polyprenyltransferase) [Caeruleum heppii]|nr:MAG: Para-hydroxybenzoate--polyprenyltransferase, mitochondrial precursor (PHB:polyprenyltransferase) [Caeruleum heppii]
MSARKMSRGNTIIAVEPRHLHSSPSTTKSFLGAPTSTPPYNPPTTGLLTLLPRSWIPYAELIRLDKPTGTIYLLFPCLFSTLLFAPLTYPVPSPPTTVLSTCLLFSIGALVMRGAGCTINDLWDRNLDPLVGRTRLRPLARRAVSPRQALLFAAAQLSVGLAVLLSFPPAVFFYATPSLLFVALYPLAKRVTHYPQFVLGLTFSWGALLGFPALGIDPFALSSAAEGPTAVLPGLDILTAAAFLYTSNIAWTVLYDTIYAHMDLPFDRSAGIKSIAVAHSRHAKKLLSSLAVVQIGLLAAAGVTTGAGPLFFAGACGGAAVSLGVMIRRVDLTCVRSCWWWFRYGAWFTGGAVVLGLGGDYVARVKGWYGEAFAAKERLAMEG